MRQLALLVVTACVFALTACPDAIADGKAKMDAERGQQQKPAAPTQE